MGKKYNQRLFNEYCDSKKRLLSVKFGIIDAWKQLAFRI